MELEQIFILIGIIVGSYFVGNINNATLISKLKKQDIRKMGSGNPGTMNMIRNFGPKLGALTLVLDILKGALPTLAGWYFFGGLGFNSSRLGMHCAALSVIAGHIFPVIYKFKGGKGIASAVGACFVAQWWITLIMLAFGIAFILITKMGSVTSFLIISIPLAFEAFSVHNEAMVQGVHEIISYIVIFSLFSLTLFAHRKNIVKLFLGKESKTVVFKKKNESAS